MIPILLLLISMVQIVTSYVYFPVFIAYSGNRQSVYDAWITPRIGYDMPTLLDVMGKKIHIRSHFIDHWKGVIQVRLELFNKNRRVMWIKFNGKGSNKFNWFSKERVLDSSFNDLAPCSTFNYFSLYGETRQTTLDRKFFINRSYRNCDNDFGWFCIADKYQACPWEKKSTVPSFIYTKNYSPRNYTNDSLSADTMVISVLLKL